MKNLIKIVIYCVLFCSCLLNIVHSTYVPKLVSKLAVNKPAFALFVPNANNSQYSLAISSFNGAPKSADFVTYFSNFSINSTYTQSSQLSNKNLVWPNELSYTNSSLLINDVDPYGGVVVPGGFLVPTKENGGIFYYPFVSEDRTNVTNLPPYELTLNSQGKTKWFYHRVQQVDVSGDGIKDLLTCRTYKPIIGQTQVQLVAFILDPESGLYNEKVILNDVCDVFFEVADIDFDGRVEIVAAGFFIAQMNIIYSNDVNNSFIKGDVIAQSIDTSGDKFFDIKLVDLDKKGNLEILATNHQGPKDQIKGSLYYYTLSGNIKTGKWKRNLIYDNFPVLKSGIQQAAPGGAKIFYPNLNEANNTRPYILVSGDGAEQAYLFEPSKTDPLSYKLVWSQLYKGFTVGGTSIADLNADGFNEIIIPIYESNTCYVYTLKN